MRTIKAKNNTLNRPFGIIYFDLLDIDGEPRDTLQFCETLENAEFLYARRGSGEKAEIVAIDLTPEAVEEEEEDEEQTMTEAEALEQYDQMLDECYPMVKVCGYEYDPSRALKELDPIAYRVGFSDYCSSLEDDGILISYE